MESPSPRYTYQPLDRAAQEIRLITLHPPSEDLPDLVECSISHTPLAEAKYNALSYTWGSPDETYPMVLNGFAFPVTRNLYLALHQLRHSFSSIPLWIDAVAINQEDLDERGHQVSQMRDIFARAEQVIAWIGPRQSGNEEQALRLVLESATRADVPGIETTDAIHFWVQEDITRDRTRWTELANLLERPWFSRVWIVQELVVAQKVTLVCGNMKMQWKDFQLGVAAIYQNLIAVADASRNVADDKDMNDQFIDRLGNGCFHVRIIASSRSEWLAKDRTLPFSDIVRRYSLKNATDPRDKIYALEGIVDPDSPELNDLRPDYANVTSKELFIKAARIHLQNHKDLRILLDNCGPLRPDGLPSWVPHWNQRTTTSTFRPLTIPGIIEYFAGGRAKPLFRFSQSQTSLILKGIIIDKISQVGYQHRNLPKETLEGRPYTSQTVLDNWSHIAGLGAGMSKLMSGGTLSETESLAASRPYIGGGSRGQAFTRTILMNPSAAIEMAYLTSQASHGFGSPSIAIPSTDHHAVARQSRACLNRKFFVTEKGYMGTTFPEVMPGDTVCVFLGGMAPFVIREDGTTYLLVGDAYVHGIMEGEVLVEVLRGSSELVDIELT